MSLRPIRWEVLCVPLLCALIASPSRAQISSVTNLSGFTRNNPCNSDGCTGASQAFTTDDGTTLTSRFAFNVNADTTFLLSRNQSGSFTHEFSFVVTAPAGYRLDISTSFVGQLAATKEDDTCGAAGALLSGVTGSTSVALSSGSLSIAADWPAAIPQVPAQEISGSSAATILGVGNGSPQSYTLTFTFDALALSHSCEAAVRFGEPNATTTGCETCNYPGSPSRNMDTDGHFVTVTLTPLCGNGVVDSAVGEVCDAGTGPSGNGSPTSCCSDTCQFTTAGQPCSDGNPCTNGDVCDGSGACSSGAPCQTCEVCDTVSGCTAAIDLGCEPGAVGKSELSIVNASGDTADRVTFKWKGANAISKQDFGSPMSISEYQLCIYDDEVSPGQPKSLVYSMTAPAGATCDGSPCWQEFASGYHAGYLRAGKPLTPDGVQRVRLRAGAARKNQIVFKAKGGALGLVPHDSDVFFSQSSNVTVVVVANDAPKCFRAVFPQPAVTNRASRYRDRD